MDGLIHIVPCLADAQCEQVLAGLDQLAFRPSTMFSAQNERGLTVNPEFRSSTSLRLPENCDAAALLHRGMNEALIGYKDALCRLNGIFDRYPVPGGWHVDCHREAIQILRYEAGQKYEFHHDASDQFARKESQRTVSVIVYLTDEFAGGGTEFINRAYRPRRGEALIFPSGWTHPHRGQPVTSGTKIVAVTWYYSKLRRG